MEIEKTERLLILVLFQLIDLGKGAAAEALGKKLSIGCPMSRLKCLRMEEKPPVEE